MWVISDTAAVCLDFFSFLFCSEMTSDLVPVIVVILLIYEYDNLGQESCQWKHTL